MRWRTPHVGGWPDLRELDVSRDHKQILGPATYVGYFVRVPTGPTRQAQAQPESRVMMPTCEDKQHRLSTGTV